MRGGLRVSTADLPHSAKCHLSGVHFYKRASTAGSLECRGRPWSRVPPRPTQGQPPAVGEVEGTTTRQHCSSAAIWRSSPRADTHERPPAKRHHACLPASLGLNHTSFWPDDSWIPKPVPCIKKSPFSFATLKTKSMNVEDRGLGPPGIVRNPDTAGSSNSPLWSRSPVLRATGH